MDIDNIKFIGLELTVASKDKIKSNILMMHDNIHCDHVTLWYFDKIHKQINEGGYYSDHQEDYIFQRGVLSVYQSMEAMKYPVLFKATGVLSNNKCQTLLLSHIDHLKYINTQIPHITLSTTDDTKPVYSNNMIYDVLYENKVVKEKVKENKCEYEEIDILLEGYVKYYLSTI